MYVKLKSNPCQVPPSICQKCLLIFLLDPHRNLPICFQSVHDDDSDLLTIEITHADQPYFLTFTPAEQATIRQNGWEGDDTLLSRLLGGGA